VSIGPILFRFISIAALAVCMAAPSLAVDGQTTIAFAENRIGMPPADFDLGITGHGHPGKWTIVHDETAAGGVAIEQSSDDPTDDRFDFAVYQSLSLKNLAASTRFKLITGTMKSAGLVFRFRDAGNYYVLRANALESRVDVFRVLDGEMKRVSGTDADVALGHWQTLKLVANGDQFEVSLDNTSLFTVWDQTFLTDGRVGLWTQEDNLTRFDQFAITALPWSEGP
jgi:hypothetical protein